MISILSHWIKYVAILVGLMLTVNAESHAAAQQQSKQRDLSLYDFGGALEIKLSTEGIGTIEGKVRAFIWRHFKEHRLGYISVTQYSKEGEPSTSTYFVEQNEGHEWNLLVKIERRIIERGDSIDSKWHNATTEYVAHLIQRIDAIDSKLIEEDTPRAPESYRLRLKDKCGKVLAEI